MKTTPMKIQMKLALDNPKTATLDIFEEIGGFDYSKWEEINTAGIVSEFLQKHDNVEDIKVRINSTGGDAFEGLAIANMLKSSGKKISVEVLGIAASAASVIAMAGDTIKMWAGSLMMIHRPWTFAMGNSSDLRAQADELDKVSDAICTLYTNKAGDKLSAEKLSELIAGPNGDGTYLSPEECLEYGLCTDIVTGAGASSDDEAASEDPDEGSDDEDKEEKKK